MLVMKQMSIIDLASLPEFFNLIYELGILLCYGC